MAEEKLFKVEYTGAEVVTLGKAGKFMPGTSAYLREDDARAAAARGDFVVHGLDGSAPASTPPAAHSTPPAAHSTPAAAQSTPVAASPAPAAASKPPEAKKVEEKKPEAKAEEKKPEAPAEKKAEEKKPEAHAEKKAEAK